MTQQELDHNRASLSWSSFQPLVWRCAARNSPDLTLKLLKEGAEEWRELEQRFGVESAAFPPAPKFCGDGVTFSFRRGWSEKLERLWQASIQGDRAVRLVPSSRGGHLVVPAGSELEHTIWTYNLGGCSALAFTHDCSSGERNLMLWHFNLLHLEHLQRSMFLELHTLGLLTTKYTDMRALLLTPGSQESPWHPRQFEEMQMLLSNLYSPLPLKTVLYEPGDEGGTDRGTLTVSARARGPVTYQTCCEQGEI